jgi:hypothetical protein
MDVTLLAVLALAAVAVFVKLRSDARRLSRGSHAHQRVFTVAAIGLWLVGFGLAGGDLRYSHGWFRGVQWADAPVWWEIAVGIGLLVLAATWARPLLRPPSR